MTFSLDTLLQQFALELKMDFKKDPSGSYSFQINGSLPLQIEMGKAEDEVLIGSFFIEIGPGKFRDNIFTYALISNQITEEPSFFGFSEKKTKLLLFQTLKTIDLNVQMLQEHLISFAKKAMKWKEAIEKGSPAPADVIQNINALKR